MSPSPLVRYPSNATPTLIPRYVTIEDPATCFTYSCGRNSFGLVGITLRAAVTGRLRVAAEQVNEYPDLTGCRITAGFVTGEPALPFRYGARRSLGAVPI